VDGVLVLPHLRRCGLRRMAVLSFSSFLCLAGLGWAGWARMGWVGWAGLVWSGLFGLGWAGRLSLIIENRLGRGRLRRCQPFDETFGCDLVDFKGERLRRDRGLGFI
jgi:hypothetical protein